MFDAFKQRRAYMNEVAKRKPRPALPPGARTEIVYYRGQRVERLVEAGRDLKAYDRLPMGVLEVDPDALTVTHASAPAVSLLREIGFLSAAPTAPETGDDTAKDEQGGLLGMAIAAFDRERIGLAALIAKAREKPQRVTIPFAGRDCRVSLGLAPDAMGDGPIPVVLMFEPRVRIARRTTYSILDRIPTALLLLKFGTAEVLFANGRARTLLDDLGLEGAEGGLVGSSIGLLHDDPSALEAAAASLGQAEGERQTRFTARRGDRWIGLGLHPFPDETGTPVAGLVLLSDITQRITFAQQFRAEVQDVVNALATEVQSLARAAAAMAGQTREARTTAGRASDRVETTVAAGEAVVGDADRLADSIDTVKSRAIESFAAAGRLSGEANEAQNQVNELSTAADDIGQSIAIIEEIAMKTELLALNATVEAARAGDAGRGFAVVAGEVRSLSKDTEGATKAISQQIKRIQEAIEQTAESFDRMRATLKRVESNAGQNRDASIQDSEAMAEIRQRIHEISRQIHDTRKAIAAVDERISATDDLAGNVDAVAHEVEDRLARLTDGVTRFMREAEDG